MAIFDLNTKMDQKLFQVFGGSHSSFLIFLINMILIQTYNQTSSISSIALQ